MNEFLPQRDVDLTSLNTLGFSVCAHRYVAIRSARELSSYFKAYPDEDCFVLGGGSNLVLTRDIDATVLHMQSRGVAVYEETDTHVVVGVQAGEIWHDFVMASVARGWFGLENLALIPGTVGACPVQNIGAYGVEIKDALHKVKAWDRLTQSWVWFDNAQCEFSYRDSVFKHAFLDEACTQSRYVISKVFFKLLKDKTQWQPKIGYGDVATRVADLAAGGEVTAVHVAQAIIEIRSTKLPDPKVLGNTGSFFKNPIVDAALAAQLKTTHPNAPMYPQPDGTVKIAAGWLIEQAGFKGLRDGAVGVYEKQALVLVHHGGGTGAELMALAQRISAAVFTQFGVRISPEPMVI
ncbi:UDP-N-acetylenolpyruvoylglucosamine reductase [Formosimonas limnophila]|uniref:UDP-N-acetylenolpyruvoylglucosamine reductase n=1 Tax=Formosimonas limnophila TaxID=1384487 RepID=A0A8J3G0R7_9BURK|nr:UDP-N-acetylmuramate dehydrogenase [Formosimonas limnophila]GHA74713.1 UDP-N-acetylenolpyruvoylglucosamine reductase [Formosimonas limnophila]